MAIGAGVCPQEPKQIGRPKGDGAQEHARRSVLLSLDDTQGGREKGGGVPSPLLPPRSGRDAGLPGQSEKTQVLNCRSFYEGNEDPRKRTFFYSN